MCLLEEVTRVVSYFLSLGLLPPSRSEPVKDTDGISLRAIEPCLYRVQYTVFGEPPAVGAFTRIELIRRVDVK